MPKLRIPKDKPSPQQPCCGVFAVALMAGVSFEKATKAVRKVGNYGPNWQGSSYSSDRWMALLDLGCATKRVPNPDRLTFGKFFLTLKWGPCYMISAGRHTFVLHEGLVYDQGRPEGVPLHKVLHFNRRRVTSCYERIDT